MTTQSQIDAGRWMELSVNSPYSGLKWGPREWVWGGRSAHTSQSLLSDDRDPQSPRGWGPWEREGDPSASFHHGVRGHTVFP